MKKQLVKNTPEEDIAIRKGVAGDPDTFEMTDKQFRLARRGRPVLDNPKQPVTIRLDAPVVEYFKATGKGWQSRINSLLAKHVAKKPGKTG